MIYNLGFGCMGTRVHMLIDGEAALLPEATALVQRLDSVWSRFKEDSEVSRANAAAGAPVQVSQETLVLFELSARAWELTDGLFDATFLKEVVAAGYDRDFEEIRGGEGGPSLQRPVRAAVDGPGIEFDREAGTVTVPDPVGFDSGGLGKGLGAQLAVEYLLDRGASGAMVNLGGDLFAGGEAPGEGWGVTLDNPFGGGNGASIVKLLLDGGALATSTSHTRNWMQDGVLRHHIIDPRTGEPSQTDVASATVVCDQGWRAEALAKAVLLAGHERGLELLDRDGDATGLLVTENGDIHTAAGFERYSTVDPGEMTNLLERRTVTFRFPPQMERTARN